MQVNMDQVEAHDTSRSQAHTAAPSIDACKDASGLSPSRLRIGKRYRANRLQRDDDAIVIGSGIGGLTSAALLSQAGEKVLVLEQHYTAGGFTHAYARNGYEWDVGVHYIGGMQESDEEGYEALPKQLFDFISNHTLKWAPMHEHYDRIILGTNAYDFVAGKDNFIAQLKIYFPAETQAIDAYVELLLQAQACLRTLSMHRSMPLWLAKFSQRIRLPRVPDYMFEITYSVLSRLTQNAQLIAVLTGQWGDFGLSTKRSPFLMHATIAHHYLYGAYYPVGGASQIAQSIIPQIQSSGGEVFTYAKVQQILLQGRRAIGVVMKDGTEILAPVIISATGAKNTFNRLLPQQVSRRWGYQEATQQLERSKPHVCLYIGLKGSAQELGLCTTNLWVFHDGAHDSNVQRAKQDPDAPFPFVFISFPSAKDPTFNQRYPGRSTIEIVVPGEFDQFRAWGNTPWGNRGESYNQLKQSYADRMLEVLYQQLPHLRGKIDYYEVSTPLSTQHFCQYDEGEIYGLAHTRERFEQQEVRVETKLRGLYMTGQDTLTCGVTGAMMAGMVTTISILGPFKFALLMRRIQRSSGSNS